MLQQGSPHLCSGNIGTRAAKSRYLAFVIGCSVGLSERMPKERKGRRQANFTTKQQFFVGYNKVSAIQVWSSVQA
jgi:hypothetical protein